MTDPTPGTPTPSPRPTPGAMPGRIPTPGDLARPAATPKPKPTPKPAPVQDPHRFGRVAEDGTVYLVTADGEREIGQWQAGTPEEGLRHFAGRYDDLVTEVAVLESRLSSHPEDADAIRAQAATLAEGLDEAAVIGDIEALRARLGRIGREAGDAKGRVEESRKRRREEAVAAKEKLIAETEDIAENSTQWKAAGDRIRAILEEWKKIRGIDRATDDRLWKRYARARDAFHRRRGAHFAELDRGRAAAKRRKEELVERAVALQDSTEWRETARAYRDLMQEWKAAGRAPREADDRLWEQFRAAQDKFFGARDAVNAEKDREFAANGEAKDALIAEYEPLIDPDKNLDQARAKLTELQEKWDEIGYVPKSRMRELEDKIAGLEKRVTDAERSKWRRTDPEAQERAAQFTRRVDELTAQAEQAEERGDAKKAEQLRAQAAQWSAWAETAAEALEDR